MKVEVKNCYGCGKRVTPRHCYTTKVNISLNYSEYQPLCLKCLEALEARREQAAALAEVEFFKKVS